MWFYLWKISGAIAIVTGVQNAVKDNLNTLKTQG